PRGCVPAASPTAVGQTGWRVKDERAGHGLGIGDRPQPYQGRSRPFVVPRLFAIIRRILVEWSGSFLGVRGHRRLRPEDSVPTRTRLPGRTAAAMPPSPWGIPGLRRKHEVPANGPLLTDVACPRYLRDRRSRRGSASLPTQSFSRIASNIAGLPG